MLGSNSQPVPKASTLCWGCFHLAPARWCWVAHIPGPPPRTLAGRIIVDPNSCKPSQKTRKRGRSAQALVTSTGLSRDFEKLEGECISQPRETHRPLSFTLSRRTRRRRPLETSVRIRAQHLTAVDRGKRLPDTLHAGRHLWYARSRRAVIRSHDRRQRAANREIHGRP
jgi:hypothetical protein